MVGSGPREPDARLSPVNGNAGPTVRLVYFALSRDEVSPLVEEFQHAFPGATVAGVHPPAEATGPLVDPAVIEFIVDNASDDVIAFFVGKASGFAWGRMAAVWENAKRVRDDRGGAVLGVRAEREVSEVIFQFVEAPTSEAYKEALRQVPSLMKSVPAGEFAVFRFDPERQAWGEPELATPEVRASLLQALAARRGTRASGG